MIRINLLPVRQVQAARTGKQFMILFVAFLAVEAVGLFLYQQEQEGVLNEHRTTNAKLAKDLQKLEAQTAKIEELENQAAQLQQQQLVLDGLLDGQAGPVRVLRELAYIMTRPTDPEELLRIKNLGWDPEWEPKNLWIDAFTEKRRNVQFKGHARSNEDLAEFLLRLNTSVHFVKVELNVSEMVEVGLGKVSGGREKRVSFMKYDITALCVYGKSDVEKLAMGKLGVDPKKKSGGH